MKRTEAGKLPITFVEGALAGFLASLPMAAVMAGLNRLLPRAGKTPGRPFRVLPPKVIILEAARHTPARREIAQVEPGGKKWGPATWLVHLGYGAATASLYPLATRPLPLPGVLRGMLFAMTVWAASYQGWLPAVGILAPASEQSPRRNAVMILSHLAWGILIALLVDSFERNKGAVAADAAWPGR